MQTLREIRQLLDEAGLRPQKAFGQCFLIDGNLMSKVVDAAGLTGGETVLEVGPGTGSLTEELLARARRVVAVEIDRGLCGLLRRRLGGRGGFVLVEGDVMAGKHRLAPAVLEQLGAAAGLVSNLPYNVATPLVIECLLQSWRSLRAGGPCRFDRLTFTVQQELADRLAAGAGSKAYGPVSVVAALLGSVRAGPAIPASAFWPRPKVDSRLLTVDFQPARASRLAAAQTLQAVLAGAFGQRRKQIGSVFRRLPGPWSVEALTAALAAGGIGPDRRAEQIEPEQYLAAANWLAAGG